ncbi:MAG: hypothetical protein ACRCXM_08205 [Beijerinckiaceae bacterium]
MADRFEVFRDLDNEEKWGKLVLGWAIGKSQFSGVADKDVAIPQSIKDLKRQCTKIGCKIKVPKTMTGLTVVQHTEELLLIRIPSKSMAEAAIKVPGDYKLPQFYDHFCGPVNATTKPQKQTLLACRLGDYSIGQCM